MILSNILFYVTNLSKHTICEFYGLYVHLEFRSITYKFIFLDTLVSPNFRKVWIFKKFSLQQHCHWGKWLRNFNLPKQDKWFLSYQH